MTGLGNGAASLYSSFNEARASPFFKTMNTIFTVHGTTEDLVRVCFKHLLFSIEPMGTRWQQCGMDFMVTTKRKLSIGECKAIEANLREWGAKRVTACWEAR